MSNQAQGQNNNAINERTYQEVEYLKKNLGPILVAALAEICIRRPADPIEYLGHWLLRWRYNEELKRRDVQNALEVVRQRQWANVQNENNDAVPPPPEPFTDGFIPSHPHGPPGFGGPLTETEENAEEVEEEDEYEEGDLNYAPPEDGEIMQENNILPMENVHPNFSVNGEFPPNDYMGAANPQMPHQPFPNGSQMPFATHQQDPAQGEHLVQHGSQGQTHQGEHGAHPGQAHQEPPQGERRLSQGQAPQGERRASQGQAPQGQAPQGERRVSQGQAPQSERRASQEQAHQGERRVSQGQAPQGERRVSQGQAPQGERRASQGQAPQGERRVSQGQAPQGERRASQGQAPPGERKLSQQGHAEHPAQL